MLISADKRENVAAGIIFPQKRCVTNIYAITKKKKKKKRKKKNITRINRSL